MCSGCSLYVAWLNASVLGLQHKSQPSPVIIGCLLHLKEHVSGPEFLNSRLLFPEKKRALETLANSLSEDDNPVLMVVTMKR